MLREQRWMSARELNELPDGRPARGCGIVTVKQQPATAKGTIFISLEDETGDIVGLAAYSFLWPAAGSSHSLFLKELYVRDTLRRQGIGARLMDELRALAAARPGCSRVEWMADRDNPGARAFYESRGFTESDGKIVYRVDSSTV